MKRADLVTVTTEPFPIGMAATNRTISYSKKLAERKEVLILIPVPTERPDNVRNACANGSIGNLRFEYTMGRTAWPSSRSRVLKFFSLLKGYIGLINRLVLLRPKVVNIYTSRLYIRLTLLLVSKITGFTLICEEDEYPKILKNKKKSLLLNFAIGFYRKCNGMIVMTKELEDYYFSIGARNIFRLPMTVDYERFSGSIDKSKVNYSDYFVYVGGGGGFERDGVASIVESFCIFNARKPGYTLLIVGPVDTSSSEYQKMLRYIEINCLQGQIVFVGSVDSTDIPAYLKKSIGIIMAPQRDYASGGFPTKLGEFLASGRPVVTTAVSEIPDYLNGGNSFIVPPGDCHLIAEQMVKIVDNPEQAGVVAKKGQRVAFDNFRADVYVDDIIDFLSI